MKKKVNAMDCTNCSLYEQNKSLYVVPETLTFDLVDKLIEERKGKLKYKPNEADTFMSSKQIVTLSNYLECLGIEYANILCGFAIKSSNEDTFECNLYVKNEVFTLKFSRNGDLNKIEFLESNIPLYMINVTELFNEFPNNFTKFIHKLYYLLDCALERKRTFYSIKEKLPVKNTDCHADESFKNIIVKIVTKKNVIDVTYKFSEDSCVADDVDIIIKKGRVPKAEISRLKKILLQPPYYESLVELQYSSTMT